MGYDTFEPRTILEEGTDDQLDISGYSFSPWKKWAFLLCTCGLGYFLLLWNPKLLVKITGTPCPLKTADFFLIKDIYGMIYIQRAEQGYGIPPEYQNLPLDSPYLPAGQYNYFLYKCHKYVWDGSNYTKLSGLDKTINVFDIIENYQGLTNKEYKEKLEIYGPNSIEVEVGTYFKLLKDEILNPFYMFQILSIILWSFDNYYYYASCIVVVTIISISYALFQTRQQRVTLHDMVSYSNNITVTVFRDGKFEDVPSNILVPGDIIAIPPKGCLMSCDAVLLTGTCIVNESMLTGESVPETKLPLTKHDDYYTPENHKKSTLFCGTQIIQTRYYSNQKVLALVIRTGYSTAKGQLIRSILFPKPSSFSFHRDAFRFVLFLFVISAFGMGFSTYLYIVRGAGIFLTLVRALDLVTIVVPPALPAAMTVSVVYSQRRLKKKKIFCISPQHINKAGKLKLICFDKTGTLTEDGLDLWGVVPSVDSYFKPTVNDATTLVDTDKLKVAMATCHSLTRIDGELIGDPLDLNMFEATGWELEESGSDDTSKFDIITPTIVRPKFDITKVNRSVSTSTVSNEDNELETLVSNLKENYEVGILKQFPFSSSLQRMVVITKTLNDNQLCAFVKGAPEKIVSLCDPVTVPDSFSQTLQSYTQQGYRVIALAWKQLPNKTSWHHVQKIKRDSIEENLHFLGFLVMENMMKKETKPVIEELQKAKLKCVMVTGDNILTAISVARNCQMIPPEDQIIVVPTGQDNSIDWEYLKQVPVTTKRNFHLAMDGKAFGILKANHPEELEKMITKSTIFARMAPEQKTQLVESLINIGYCVGMCGDGANDCGALKAADIGISLSEAEASVAAPFTSAIPNISCVPLVICEGRCVLVTSFSMFQFIAMYSLIQFISVLQLYYVFTNCTDFMFMYIDLVIITSFALLMGIGEPSLELVAKRPSGRLVSLTNLIPLSCQIILVIIFQSVTTYLLLRQPWIRPNTSEDLEDISANMFNTVIFYISSFQYLTMAIVLSKGLPYRAPFYKHRWYLFAVFLILFFNLIFFCDVLPQFNLIDIFKWDLHYQLKFRMTLLMLIIIFFLSALSIETFVSDSSWVKKISRFFKSGPKNKYKELTCKMENSIYNRSTTLEMGDNLRIL